MKEKESIVRSGLVRVGSSWVDKVAGLGKYLPLKGLRTLQHNLVTFGK